MSRKERLKKLFEDVFEEEPNKEVTNITFDEGFDGTFTVDEIDGTFAVEYTYSNNNHVIIDEIRQIDDEHYQDIRNNLNNN